MSDQTVCDQCRQVITMGSYSLTAGQGMRTISDPERWDFCGIVCLSTWAQRRLESR